MKIGERTSARTRSFARVLGPFLAIVFFVVAVRMPDMRTLLAEFDASRVWPWVTGSFVLLGGIAIVALHNCWREPAAVMISLLGWIMVVRGIALVAFPDTFARLADRAIGAVGVLQGAYIAMAVIGIYLTVVGWGPTGAQTQHTSSSTDDEYTRAA